MAAHAVLLLVACLQMALAYRAPIGPPSIVSYRKGGLAIGNYRAPIDSCEERWRTATLDHFSWVSFPAWVTELLGQRRQSFRAARDHCAAAAAPRRRPSRSTATGRSGSGTSSATSSGTVPATRAPPAARCSSTWATRRTWSCEQQRLPALGPELPAALVARPLAKPPQATPPGPAPAAPAAPAPPAAQRPRAQVRLRPPFTLNPPPAGPPPAAAT
jgi:hypothetical protein